MTDLGEESRTTTVHGSATDPVVLHHDNASAVPAEIFDALVQAAGFVNWRRLEVGEPAMLILAFRRSG